MVRRLSPRIIRIALKAKGFKFVGATMVYAWMLAAQTYPKVWGALTPGVMSRDDAWP